MRTIEKERKMSTNKPGIVYMRLLAALETTAERTDIAGVSVPSQEDWDSGLSHWE